VLLKDGRSIEWSEEADANSDQMSWESAIDMTYQLYDEVDVPRGMADDLITCIDKIDHSATIIPLIHQVCRATRANS
jgi:hypothetical protein